MLKRAFYFFCLLTPFTPCYAFFCGNNQYVNVGDSVNQVFSACGKPASTVEGDGTLAVEQWVYHARRRDRDKGINPRARLRFNFQQKKVLQIYIENLQAKSTTACRENYLTIGNDQSLVRMRCGDPDIKQVVTTETNKTALDWYYPGGKYSKLATKITFTDGKVSQINQQLKTQIPETDSSADLP